VASILRPLKEFDTTFSSRTPPQIGDEWKQKIIGAVSSKYSIAVEDLIATVKRTEEALKSRKTRKMMAGGMSDGEKVKLQLLLDYRQYKKDVEELGLSDSIEGLVKLNQLTSEAESLLPK
jgi:phosphoenolpyruvate carboxylase